MKRCVWMFGVVVVLVGCKRKPAVSDGPAAVPQPAAHAAEAPLTPPASPSAATSVASAAASASSKTGPQWGWQPYDEESFETQPSQGRVFTVPENATRLRVKLKSSLPVDAAAMTREVFKSAKGVVREDRLLKLPCASIGVRDDEAACELDGKDTAVYVVRDRRALSGDPAAMALLRQKSGRNEILGALPADKIHVSLAVWACVAHCVPGGPAQ